MNAARIVLIDDNVFWLETLSEYLRTKGFSVLATSDPAEGLIFLKNNQAEVVVCDYDMPGMNGLELVRAIRQHLQNLPVFMLTSQDDPTLGERVLAEGAQAFLSKTTPSRLVRNLQQLLADFEAAALRSAPTLELWQRLLPSPQMVKQGRKRQRTGSRSRQSPGARGLAPGPRRPGG